MPPIILTTINARYYHTAIGLRWLLANLGELREQAAVREFQLGQNPAQIAEALLAEGPRIIGFGVYIWNVAPMTEVARTIKSVRPEVAIVIGGPEAGHEYEGTDLFGIADYLVRGEGERPFAELALRLMRGERPEGKVIDEGPAELAALDLPYEYYTEEDITRRKVYVEASRGCPFRCEFCLSSLDERVREFPLDKFLDAMARLIERGAREFTFVDRTFNIKEDRACAILEFFLERWREGMHLHFEIVPDRLSDGLKALIAKFAEGVLHLESGVQTLNPDVQAAISRRQDLAQTTENMMFLRERTGAWIHADLIVGLPGETWESFAAGFDTLVRLRPQQIQVGVLKRLKGAPIARHTQAHGMIYTAQPPYEIMQNDAIDFFAMQRLKRFAKYFDLIYNSGNFPETLGLLLRARESAFEEFVALADRIWEKTGRTHDIALVDLTKNIYEFLVAGDAEDSALIGEAIARDYRRKTGRREKLDFLEK